MMTEEQKKLVEENTGLVYKFLANHRIYDEDLAQDLLMHLCDVIDKYNPEIAEFSTWVFTVCDRRMKYHHTTNTRKKKVPDSLITSLSETINNNEDSAELEDFLGVEDEEFEHIEDAEFLNSILTEFMKDRWHMSNKESAIEILKLVANGESYSDIGNRYGISYERVRQIYDKTRKLLIEITAHGEEMDMRIKTKREVKTSSSLDTAKWWIERNVSHQRTTNYKISTSDVTSLIKRECCIEISNEAVHGILTKLGYSAINLVAFGDEYVYDISNNCYLGRRLKAEKEKSQSMVGGVAIAV